MKKLLFVEDTIGSMKHIEQFFRIHSDTYKVYSTGCSKDALDCIDSRHVDLVITNIDSHSKGTMQLIRYIDQVHSDLPVFAVAACYSQDTASSLDKMGVFKHLSNPLDPQLLMARIEEEFKSKPRSMISGISIDSLLQLILIDRKTCTLKVKSPDAVGVLYCRKGELIDAMTSRLQGRDAAIEIVGWADTEVIMQELCRKQHNTINMHLESILLESARLRDERIAGAGEPNRSPEEKNEESCSEDSGGMEMSDSDNGEAADIAPALAGVDTDRDDVDHPEIVSSFMELLAKPKQTLREHLKKPIRFNDRITRGLLTSRLGQTLASKEADPDFKKMILKIASTLDHGRIDYDRPQCLRLNLQDNRCLYIILGRILTAGLVLSCSDRSA